MASSSSQSSSIDWDPSHDSQHADNSHTPTIYDSSANSSTTNFTNGSSAPTYTPYHPTSSSTSTSTSSRPNLGFPAYLYPEGTHSLSGIAIRSAILGTAFGFSVCFAIGHPRGFFQLPLFVALLALFHFLEYWTTAKFNTQKAKIDAFLLSSNGLAYNIAHTSAFLEALLEFYLYPSLKTPTYTTLLGLLLITLGQTFRTLAMCHAGSNFNHLVQRRREEGHVLVKTGVYRYLRHPSYFGFFYWGVGTQLLLGNPACTVGYVVVLWKFFKERIKTEEKFLVHFFGEEYKMYRKRTPVGIPFIR